MYTLLIILNLLAEYKLRTPTIDQIAYDSRKEVVGQPHLPSGCSNEEVLGVYYFVNKPNPKMHNQPVLICRDLKKLVLLIDIAQE